MPRAAATGLKARASNTGFGYGGETLTGNLPDWNSTYLLATHRRDRNTRHGGLHDVRRFGLDDSEAHAGFPGDASHASRIGVSAGAAHEVPARSSVYGQIRKSLPGGWGLGFGLGLRNDEDSFVSTNMLSAMAERYWGNFRGAYTLYSGRSDGATSVPSHRFQLNYYYSGRNAVGLSYTDGREGANVGLHGAISSDLQNWGITGQHWFAPSWALTYDLERPEQGVLYRRQGLRLGIRHNF